jgi:uncharacterized protein (TIGR03435 family)
MMRPVLLLTLAALLSASSQAQTAASPTFDVASVKASAAPTFGRGPGGPGGPGGGRDGGPGGGGGRGGNAIGGPGTNDPTRIRFNFATLKSLVIYAYGVKAYQVSGPAFLDSDRFDIEGRMAEGTTKEQAVVMLQNLLAERFKLQVHHASKDLPMYSMVVAKSGAKLKVSAPVDPAQQAQQDQPPQGPPPGMGRGDIKFDGDGFPVFPGGGPFGPGRGGRGGLGMMMAPGNRARIMGTQATPADLATQLTNMLSRPVTDQTGLTAKYDITLTFSTEGLDITGGRGGPGRGPGGPDGAGGGPEGMQPQGDPPPDLFAAIQSQLGLRLDAKKGAVDLLVVDHAEKTPVEN